MRLPDVSVPCDGGVVALENPTGTGNTGPGTMMADAVMSISPTPWSVFLIFGGGGSFGGLWYLRSNAKGFFFATARSKKNDPCPRVQAGP